MSTTHLSSGVVNPNDVLGGASFLKLNHDLRDRLFEQIKTRRANYEMAMQRGYSTCVRVVILGDKPGPGRPNTPNYHHTPFFSTKNSSLWLNKMLIENDIDENKLLWFNVELADGSALDPVHIQDVKHFNPVIICLGGNAEMWMRRNAPTSPYVKVYHPQFAKRFKSNEPYALIHEIKKALKS